MASGSDDLGEAGIGPETLRVHDWVPEGMELRFAFLVNIRRDRYIVDAKKKKKFQGGFDYPLPMDCNWSFRQFGEVICSPYPWGLHDEVEFRYYDGGTEWVKISNVAELATMFAKHKEKGQFHVRLQNDMVVPALRPSRAKSCRRNGSSSQNSSVGGPSVSARRRGGSTSVGTGSRVPREVELDYVDDEERLYSDVVQNLRRACHAENQDQDEADIDASVIDDEEGEDEDLPPVQWDPENPQMEEGRAAEKFMGHIIIPYVMNELKQKTRGLEMDMTLCSDTTAEPVAPDDENDAHQLHDFAKDPNDASGDDQIEAPNDDQIDYQSDQNVEQNDAAIEAPNDGDQNVEQNDAPIEAPKDGDQNVE
ncbi:hypothetical protein ACQ4PT_026683 [Festuca glaucescens]